MYSLTSKILALLLATPLIANAAILSIPNFSFETDAASGTTYSTPSGWDEDFSRTLSGAGFAHSGLDISAGALQPQLGAKYARVSIIGDADAETSFFGSISTEPGTIGTYEAETVYTLSFYVARSDYTGSNQRFLHSGFRSDSEEVATITGDITTIATAEDTWFSVSVVFDTAQTPSVVGKDIDIFLGWEHNENHNKSLFFDNVTLTSVPEPSVYAAGAALLALGVVWLRRRRS